MAVLFKVYTSTYTPRTPLIDVDQISKQQNPVDGTTPNTPNTGLPAAAVAPGERANATFITLARNTDIWEIAKSIRQIEDRFNHKFHYDWVFLNDKPFDAQFKKLTTALTSGTAKYGLIPKEHWSFPEWIDQEKAKKVREDMVSLFSVFCWGGRSLIQLQL